MRVIFYTFLSILGISLSVIILMPSLFDINNYKGKIEKLFYNKTNNTLKISGDISLSFLSGLRLSVKDISFVSNDGENLFQSEELLISPKFFPLLKGELLFNSVKIVKPTIYITKKKNEKYNFPGFMVAVQGVSGGNYIFRLSYAGFVTTTHKYKTTLL